jgi:thiol-disulfide isomerase/thioredoxin
VNVISVSLGPIALPLLPIFLVFTVWASSFVGSRIAKKTTATSSPDLQRNRSAASDAVLHAALVGGIASRIVYVGLNLQAYTSSPILVLDIRDGGWNALTWAAVSLAWLLFKATRTVALRPALLGAGLTAGLLAYIPVLVSVINQVSTLPSLVVIPLEKGSKPITLTQATRGRPVVVNLWATWCGPCRQEMPALVAAQKREKEIGIMFVNQGESDQVVQKFLNAQGLPIQEVFLDLSSSLGPLLGSQGLPTTVFFDAQGNQVDAHVGVLNSAALESRIRVLKQKL